MHSAPSVSYPVGRSPFAAWATALVAGAGLLVSTVWSLQAGAFGWRQAAAFALVFACAAFAHGAWRRSHTGVLQWDGLRWLWHDEGARTEDGRPEIALDLQSRLLLRWLPEGGGVRWLWVERQSAPSHWDALRRAVYSRAGAPIPAFPRGGKESPPAGKPPAAEQ